MQTLTARSCLLAIGLVTILAGCTRRGPAPANLALLRAAGDQASLTVVVQPARFQAAVTTLRPFLATWSEPGAQEVLAAKDLWSAVRAASVAVPTPKKPDLPPSLAGWDQSRPIVAALFEPQVGDLVLAARSVLPVSMRQILETGLPGVRHRVLVPATAPMQLAQALARILDQAGLKAYLADKADPGLKGGFLFLTPGQAGFAALIPEADHVRIELLTDDHTPAGDDAARIAAWSALLARPVGAAEAAGQPSPALRLAASGGHFVAFHVRPWRLRDLGSQIGTRQVFEAMIHVATDMRMQLLAAGLAAVANGYLMMERDRPEFDDLCVAWDLDGGLRATAVASLTSHGVEVFQAGLDQGRAPPAPVGKPLAWAWSRLDLNAMLQTAGTLSALAQATKPHEAMQAIQECGFFCPLHFLLTSPFGAARSAVDFAPVDLSNKLPRGFSLALIGLDPKADFAVRAEVAARFPAGFNTRPIREGLQDIGRSVPMARNLGLHTESVAGDELISLTLGLQPGEGLAGEVKASEGVLGEAHVDLKGLVSVFGPAGLDRQPEVARTLGLLGTWRSRSVLVDRALVGESLLSLTRGDKQKELAWIDPDDFEGKAWDAGAPGKPSKGERCLLRVTRSMMEGFRALAMVAPDQRNLMLAKAIQETDQPLACALAEPDTAALAKRTQLMTQLFLAERLADEFQDERELLVLGKACKQGHAQACERAEAATKRPKIALAEVRGSCGPGSGWGQPALRVKTAADLEALTQWLAQDRVGQLDPTIALDADATWSTAVRALAVLAEKDIDRVGLVVREPAGGVRTIEVARPGAKAKPDAYGMARFKTLEEPGQRKNELSVLIESDKVLLMDAEATYYLDHRKDCKPGQVCADLEILGLEFDRLAKSLVQDAPVLVQIDGQVPFRDAAAVLGRISCAAPRSRWGGAPAREIVVGPLPQGTVDRAQARKLTAGGGKGVLAILGTKGEASALFSAVDRDGGLGGLGTRGSGGGGLAVGKLNRIGTGGGGGSLGLKKQGKGIRPRIKAGKATVMGSLSKEIIRRVLRRHFAAFRYCYEKVLVRNPKLNGKVVVKFVISPTGTVQTAQVIETTLKSKEVENCVLKVIKRMKFPSPKGGGIVIVSYPFIFNTTD